MSENVENSSALKAIAKGGAIVILGRLVGKFLSFFLVVLIVRLVTKAEWGIISLAWVMLNVAATMASFGLVTGTPRFIAKCRSELSDHKSVIGEIIASAGLFTLVSSMIMFALLYIYARQLAGVFNHPGLYEVLRVFAFLGLPLVGIQFLTGIFRGLESALPRFIFQDVLTPFVRIGIVAPLFAFDERFHLILLAYVLSTWVTFILFVVYATRSFRYFGPLKPKASVLFTLMRFSIPLLGVALILNSTSWVGPLLLGLWEAPGDVAAYTVALRMAEVLSIGITAVGFIFMPIATRAYASRDMNALSDLYSSTTKWASAFSLPLIIFFTLDADYLVVTFFSADYSDSSSILRILAVAYLFHTVLGLNGSALLACGKSARVFAASVVYGLTTALLALFLTGPMGVQGVAIAASAGLIFYNLYLSFSLYQLYGIRPLDEANLRPIALLTVGGGLVTYFLLPVVGNRLMGHLFVLLVLYGTSFVSLLLTSSLDTNDLNLLGALERRLTGQSRLCDRLEKRSGLGRERESKRENTGAT